MFICRLPNTQWPHYIIVRIRWVLYLFIHTFVGCHEIVQKLIEKGVNVNAANNKNNTALLLAAEKGDIQDEYFD